LDRVLVNVNRGVGEVEVPCPRRKKISQLWQWGLDELWNVDVVLLFCCWGSFWSKKPTKELFLSPEGSKMLVVVTLQKSTSLQKGKRTLVFSF